MAGFNAAYSGSGVGAIKFQQAVSGNPYKDNGGTALNAGNVNIGQPITGRIGNLTNSLSLSTNAYRVSHFSGRIAAPVSPTSSGNVGITYPMPSGTQFGTNYSKFKGQASYGRNFTGMITQASVAGYANTMLRGGAGDFGRKNGFTLTPVYTHRIFNILSWDYVTGRATKGGNAGSGITFLPDSGALVNWRIPGRLFYLATGKIPTQDSYKQQNG